MIAFIEIQKETDIVQEDSDTIEEKRRKNVVDNQKFLESLNVFNVYRDLLSNRMVSIDLYFQVRDDLKSTVNSVTTKNKPARKKSNRKENIDQ